MSRRFPGQLFRRLCPFAPSRANCASDSSDSGLPRLRATWQRWHTRPLVGRMISRPPACSSRRWELAAERRPCRSARSALVLDREQWREAAATAVLASSRARCRGSDSASPGERSRRLRRRPTREPHRQYGGWEGPPGDRGRNGASVAAKKTGRGIAMRAYDSRRMAPRPRPHRLSIKLTDHEYEEAPPGSAAAEGTTKAAIVRAAIASARRGEWSRSDPRPGARAALRRSDQRLGRRDGRLGARAPASAAAGGAAEGRAARGERAGTLAAAA